MVIRPSGKEWSIESSHILRGYRGCQTNLEARVRQYESKNLWSSQCDLGIGVFEEDRLVEVLMAVDLGRKPVKGNNPSLPLDDMLGAMGLTRHDVKK